MTIIAPADAKALCAAIAGAAADGMRLSIMGGGSKRMIGAPVADAATLDMRGFAGIVDYDPPELILCVRPGTPLAEIEQLLESHGQMLAFDPVDPARIFGLESQTATIGGVVASSLAGARRLSAGGVRDHLLGFEAVSGRGERFVAGGKVVKNVTGYDLPKLMAGSWGRLAAFTELTLKVLPRARCTRTLVLHGLDPMAAGRAMALAMRSQAGVAAAAHLPGGKASITVLRIEGFELSVKARCALLERLLAEAGTYEIAGEESAAEIWAQIRHLAPLADGRPLWRISVPPSAGPAIVEALQPYGARWLFDWAGGLVWMTLGEEQAMHVREQAIAHGGHAMLFRASESMRRLVPTLHPLPPVLEKLEARVRRAFDPAGIFETGRFGDRDA